MSLAHQEDPRDQRIQELEAQVTDLVHREIQLAYILAIMSLHHPLPAVTQQQRRRAMEAAFDLEHIATRYDPAQALANAVATAGEEHEHYSVQWKNHEKKAAKKAQKLGNPGALIPGAVQANHPRTSWEAADLQVPKAKQRLAVLNLYIEDAASRRNQGFTANEVAGILGISRTGTANTRINELEGGGEHGAETGGWLRPRGDTRPTGPRDSGMVHELTPAAREKLGLLVGPSLPQPPQPKDPEQPSLL